MLLIVTQTNVNNKENYINSHLIQFFKNTESFLKNYNKNEISKMLIVYFEISLIDSAFSQVLVCSFAFLHISSQLSR